MQVYYTPSQAAQFLGVSYRTLIVWDKDGTFPASMYTPCGHRRYRYDALLAFSEKVSEQELKLMESSIRRYAPTASEKRKKLGLVSMTEIGEILNTSSFNFQYHVNRGHVPAPTRQWGKFKYYHTSDLPALKEAWSLRARSRKELKAMRENEQKKDTN